MARAAYSASHDPGQQDARNLARAATFRARNAAARETEEFRRITLR